MALPQPSPYLPNPMYLTLEEVRSSVTWAITPGGAEGTDFSIGGSYSDQQINNMILQASRKIDSYIKGSLALAVRFEETRGHDNNTLRLRHWPIWQGNATTLTADAPSGSTSLVLADATGAQPGKNLFTQTAEATPPVVGANYNPPYWGGPDTVQLRYPTTRDHFSGEPVYLNGLDFVQIVLPTSFYPITTESIVVQYALGLIQNFTPLIFQRTGYNPIFTKNTPIQIQYTSGLLPDQYPPTLKQACLDLMLYQVAARVLTGIKRYRSGQRTVEYEDAFAKGIPPSICDALCEFKRSVGIY